MICQLNRRDNTNPSPSPIIIKRNDQLSTEFTRNRRILGISEEVINQWLGRVVSVELWTDSLNIGRNVRVCASGDGSPPLVCDCAAGEDEDHAINDIIVALVMVY